WGSCRPRTRSPARPTRPRRSSRTRPGQMTTTTKIPERGVARSSNARNERRGRLSGAGWAGLGFVLPCIVLFLLFRFGPALMGILLSFANYTIGGTIEWKGLGNYERMFADASFWNALRVTVVYAVISVPLT